MEDEFSGFNTRFVVKVAVAMADGAAAKAAVEPLGLRARAANDALFDEALEAAGLAGLV